ncbi:MAG: DMT family transporter [Flavobacteriaceae bacterium]|nr:DMT family transporter [Flavobacteriaceae bacterium]
MPNAKLTNYFHLHFIIFIWSFTAILGKLINLDALPLVWARMLFAVLFILGFMWVRKYSFRVSKKIRPMLVLGGIAIALHWITFFHAIKVANVSITLATMASGALFTAILEPIWYKRKFIGYELVFGLLVILGLAIIFQVNSEYKLGFWLGLLSTFLGAIFTLINGRLVMEERPTTITFYELLVGAICVTLYGFSVSDMTLPFTSLPMADWLFLGILVTVCTAYAFIASVKVMRYIRPFTVMLTVNLEPVYGIVLAYFIFGEDEKMHPNFYLGALIILVTVITNGILKNRSKSAH